MTFERSSVLKLSVMRDFADPQETGHLTPATPRENALELRMRKPKEGRLNVEAPFHLEATVRVLQRRSWNPVDVWEHDSYLRLIHSRQGPALVKVWNARTLDDPDLKYSILTGRHSLAVHASVRATLTRILGLDASPLMLQRHPRDDALTSTVRSLRGMRPPRFPTLFESFASVIPFQQLSIDAGLSILGKLVDRLGEHLTYQGRRYCAFPKAAAVAEAPVEALQACGLSLKKVQTLQTIARAIESGSLAEHDLVRMESAEAIEHLARLPGVGPWTAGLVLLRGFGRMDVFPSGDSGAARALRKLIRIDESTSTEEAVAAFGPSRGYLYFCCLGASLIEKGLIRPAPAPPR